jgi:hypothetical protein
MGAGTGEIGADRNNNIRALGVMLPSQTKRLPNDALDPISFYRAAESAVNAYPEPAPSGGGRPADQGKPRATQALSLSVYRFKLPALAEQGAFCQSLTGQLSGRQPSAALSPAGADHRPASPGTHSLPEAMGPFTLNKTRLKSTFAHFLHPHWVNQGQLPWVSSKTSPSGKRITSAAAKWRRGCRYGQSISGNRHRHKLQKQNVNHIRDFVSNNFVDLGQASLLRKQAPCAILRLFTGTCRRNPHVAPFLPYEKHLARTAWPYLRLQRVKPPCQAGEYMIFFS